MNIQNSHRTTKQPCTPASFEKGHDFENYIITLFNLRKFKLLYWRSDKIASNGAFPLSNSYPDLEIVFVGSKQHKFAIECKWREKFIDGKINWANDFQISKYVEYQKEYGIPVFIAIGVGGLPSSPEKLFVTPLCNISMYPEVFESQLIPYVRKTTHKFFYDTVQLKLF